MFFAQTIFTQLVALLLLALTGWVLTRTGKITDDRPLNALLTNVALPALIIANLQTPYSVDLLRDMGLTFAGMMAIFAVGWPVGVLAARLAGKTAPRKGAWIACIIFPNAVFMAQPILAALYDEQVLILIAPIVLAFNLTCYVLGGWVLSGEEGEAYGLKYILLKPPVLSCFMGLALFFLPFRLPAAILSPMKMLAAMTTPLSMIIIGCQLARITPQSLFLDGEVYIVSFVRLVVTALVAHGVLRLFIADPTILGVVTISGSMPCAAILPIVAKERGGDSLFCSKMVLISTLLCVLTVPLLLQLLLR